MPRIVSPTLDLEFMRTPLSCLLLASLLAVAACPTVAPAQEWSDPAVLDEAVAEALKGKQVHLEPQDPSATAAPPPAMALGAASLGGFFELLTYVLLAAGVVLLITVILQKTGVLDRGDRAAPGEEVAEVVDDEPTAPRVPDAATVAAARGDFGEALRLLLGEVLPRFYRGRGRGWPEAWTSRQCLRRVERAEPAREPLAGLIGAVERHHFGGQPADHRDWDHWERRASELQPAPAGEGAR